MRSLRKTEPDPIIVNTSIRELQDFARKTFTTVLKLNNETTNTDTTFSNDAVLLFQADASIKYRFHFVVFYDTPTAADFKWQLTGPASPTLVLYDGRAYAPGATAATVTRDNAFSSAHSLTETSGTAGFVDITGILHNGTTAGLVNLQWAQNGSNGSNTTVYAGSYLEFSSVP